MPASLRAIAALVALFACANCQGPVATKIPTAPPTLDPVSSSALSEAIRFRAEFGLRSDEAFVRAVFADPSATDEFGVPLLPDEAVVLRARASESAEIAMVVRTYGTSVPDAYAGVYIDSKTGMVFGLFTDHLDEAQAAIRVQLSPLASFVALPARYKLADLNATLAAASLDKSQAWLASVGAPFRGGSVRVQENDVWLLLGGMPRGGSEAVAHYLGVDPGMIALSVEPNLLANLPRGSIRGTIVDGDGMAVIGRELDVIATGDVNDYEPDGGVGITTDVAGTFSIGSVATMGWTIVIRDPSTGDTLGIGHVFVVGGQVSSITIPIVP